MKKLIALSALAATFAIVGCSSLLGSLGYVPVASPSASPTTAAPVIPVDQILKLVCSSPAAAADPKIGAYCAIYNALGASVVK